MNLQPTPLDATASAKPPSGPGSAGSAPVGQQNTAFAHVWARVAPGATGQPASSSKVLVEKGDTLIGLVKAHYRQQGLPISENQAFRLAHQVAADNAIADPNLILEGQQVDFGRLQLPALARAPSPPSTELALANRVWGTSTPVPRTMAAVAPSFAEGTSANTPHAVLDTTLARAVDKGFLPANELGAVRDRVLALADRYRFAPDDFARLTLMESGGMNPQASNGHCHGIIQFCDGPARGAASVGMRNNPRDILGMSLLKQLDLVDRYFSQAGLGQAAASDASGKVSLDELYLTVLTPAARSERRRNAALDIAGPQASYLHVDRDRQKPITRESIVQGLYAYTNSVLMGASAARKPAQQYAQTQGGTAP